MAKDRIRRQTRRQHPTAVSAFLRRGKRRFDPLNPLQAELDPIVRLWLLRMLVPLGAMRSFAPAHGIANDELAFALGLGHWTDNVMCEYCASAVHAQLRELHRAAEAELAPASVPVRLRENVARLSKMVGLSELDERLLEFTVMIHHERLLDDTADWLGSLSSLKVFRLLSMILDLPEAEIRSALGAGGILFRSGLVSIQRMGQSTLRCKVNLLSDNFADLMMSSDGDPISLLRGTVSKADASELQLADYVHVKPSLDILLPYLRQVTALRQRGVNVLVHGSPGTGKTQLTRCLADELGCELFEVASEDTDGDPITGVGRLRAFRAAQSFFSQRDALIVFDEIEDVFHDGDSFLGKRSTAQLRKAWLNRMLEENPVPALWLSNSIQGVDPAFMRRFDMVFEVPVPPKPQRERILQKICGHLLDPARLARMAEVESLAPAVVSKADHVARGIREQVGAEHAAQAFEHLIGSSLEAQGRERPRLHDPNRLPEVYDPALVHADANLSRVSAGLIGARSGRLCLYGPPGTGKTAYGRWLAEQLGMPLVVKRASDLISMWVGQSEKNIAHAFRQAEQDGAVLMIDEVDGFLQDRRGAQRGWEVSQVNEMLTQMESYPGVFIASTNLMQGLDPAALRRFDLKVKFDFLRQEQAWELLCRYGEQLQLAAPPTELRARLARLTQLAPGDFATVLRQHRFNPITSLVDMVGLLEAECALKEGAKVPIGFV